MGISDQVLTLDCSHRFSYQSFSFFTTLTLTLTHRLSVFLRNNCLLLALKSGELFMVTLVPEVHTVSQFVFERVGGTVMSSCLCLLGSSHLFVGSRLGNSVLVAYHEEESIVPDVSPATCTPLVCQRLILFNHSELEPHFRRSNLVQGKRRRADSVADEDQDGLYADDYAAATVSLPPV